MSAQNCWEFKKCGKEDSCPAASFSVSNGFAGGVNGGRACAYVTGTFCAGSIQGTFRDKEKNCNECEFYKLLRTDHGADMSHLNFLKYVKNQSPLTEKVLEAT